MSSLHTLSFAFICTALTINCCMFLSGKNEKYLQFSYRQIHQYTILHL